MKKVIVLFLLSCIIYSCCERRSETIYTFGNLSITRIDRCAKTYFYYSTPQKKDAGVISVEYHGFTNSWFKAYLDFDTINSKVSILPCDGIFEGYDLDTTIFSIEDLDYERSLTIKEKENCYQICLCGDGEIEFNKDSKSKVDAQYIKDESNWWRAFIPYKNANKPSCEKCE